MKEHFDCLLSSRTCLNYLHRLGFVLKRPKKHLLKANAEKRAVFVREYVDLCAEALATGAKIWFVDEAHFRADVELRAQWVQRGQPALVDSTSPRFGEKATYYSAVCLETGEVVAMPVEGNTNAETSVTFLQFLREKVDAFFAGLAERTAEVMQRCRRELQALADQWVLATSQVCAEAHHVDLTLRSV